MLAPPRTWRISAFAAFAVLTIFTFPIRSRAVTLSDYESRVSRAATLLEGIHGAGEDESIERPDQFVASNLARVRAMLPAHETVTMLGQNIAVNNSWLHESLAESEKAVSASQRAEILARIAERLRAIEERLAEIHQSRAGVPSDKDADKGRLAEILRRPEYIQMAPERSAVERLLERFLRWLSKLIPTPKPLQRGSSPIISAIAQIVVVAICIAAIAMLIWRFGPRLMQGRRKKKAKREARIVLGERLEPDQTAADLFAQAENLARNGDLRAAIRKAYIGLLCELADRKMVSLANHKTNRDYLYAVRDKTSLYNSLRKLTHSFELHWYGLVPARESDWNEFRTGYQQTLRLGSG